jgi:hypothetical protein
LIRPRILTTNDRPYDVVSDFGAVGDGVADDTAAIQAAINSGSKWIRFGNGIFRITSKLLIESTASADLTNLALVGNNATSDYAWASYAGDDGATVIQYDGAGAEPILHIKSRGILVEGITVRVAAGKAATAGILWEPAAAGPATAATRIRVSRCHVQGTLGGTGTIDTGIEIGTGAATNLDYLSIEHSAIANCEDECIYVGTTTGQSKAHSFADCLFDSSPIGINIYQGSFMANRVAFNAISDTCVNAAAGVFADTVKIDGVQSENCARFLDIGNTSDHCNVLIQNARFAIDDNYMAGDGSWIRNRSAGPTILINTLWEKVGGSDPTTPHVRTDNAGAPSQIVSIGNTYLNSNPWRHPAGVNYTRITTFGDAWRTVGSPVTYFKNTTEMQAYDSGLLHAHESRTPGTALYPTGTWHIQYQRLEMTGSQRLTLEGTARYCLTDL